MQLRPRFTGASGSPCVATTWPFLVPTMTPQPVPQKRHTPLSQRMPSVPVCAPASGDREMPATEATAINGRWVPGPGAALFRALQKAFGHPAIIAEDLGLITPEVETLRDRFQLPGMKVMQFAFSDSDNQYLPHNFTTPNCVAYTGTHDNDTAHGWWAALERKSKRFAQHYLGHRGDHIGWDLIRLAFASIANTAIFPVQDLLELDSDGRMNIPGSQDGNWNWRMEPNALTSHIAERLRELTETFGRLAPQ